MTRPSVTPRDEIVGPVPQISKQTSGGFQAGSRRVHYSVMLAATVRLAN